MNNGFFFKFVIYYVQLKKSIKMKLHSYKFHEKNSFTQRMTTD